MSSPDDFQQNGGSESGFYRSSNGDQWYLVREPGSEALLVRHRPNKASGGESSTVGIDEFLSEGHGPQHEALSRVLEIKESNDGTESPKKPIDRTERRPFSGSDVVGYVALRAELSQLCDHSRAEN